MLKKKKMYKMYKIYSPPTLFDTHAPSPTQVDILRHEECRNRVRSVNCCCGQHLGKKFSAPWYFVHPTCLCQVSISVGGVMKESQS